MMKRNQGNVGALMRRWRQLRGVSQFKLALSANLSARHVSFIESGRARPSRNAVLAIAEALAMPLRERNVLLEAAGHARVYAENGLDGIDREYLRRMVDVVLARHEPFFAVAIDRYWDVVAHNRAAEQVLRHCFGDPSAWASTPPNLLTLMLDPRCLRPAIRNWPDVAAVLLATLRTQAAERPSDERLTTLIGEMDHIVGAAELPQIVADPPLGPVLPIRFDLNGTEVRLLGAIMAFATPLDAAIEELRIETFFPADAASEAALRQAATTTDLA